MKLYSYLVLPSLLWFLSASLTAAEVEYDCILFDNSMMPGSYYYSAAEYQPPGFIRHARGKLPVSDREFFTPSNSLYLNYVSAPGGDWRAEVIYPDWRGKDFLKGGKYLDIRLLVSPGAGKEELPQVAVRIRDSQMVRLFTVDDLPVEAADTASVSLYLPLGKYIDRFEPGKWMLARVPLSDFEGIHYTSGKKLAGLLLCQGARDGKEHALYIDQIELSSGEAPAASLPVLSAQVKAYERHVDIAWDKTGLEGVKYVKIYRAGEDGDFHPVGIQLPERGRYADYTGRTGTFRYKIASVGVNHTEGTLSTAVEVTARPMSDDELLTMVQEASFRYYWDGAEAYSGMALENVPGRRNMIATGASGFGIMALIVGTERGFVTREASVARFKKIVAFLDKADRFHGVYPHFMDGPTAKVEPYFGQRDNGADLVETSFLFQGLLAARQYFDRNTEDERLIRQTITRLWEAVEWDWFRKTADSDFLYWHWSPDQAWVISHPLIGWNETMITYLLAIASPTHGVSRDMYYSGWASQSSMAQDYRAGWGETRDGSMYSNGNTYMGVKLDVGVSNGGPLFFTHYSYMGFDPHGIRDKYVGKDYFENFRNIALINYRYCVENPKNNQGFGPASWGMTASDGPWGYRAAEPVTHHDVGTMAPTGALASFPYAPEQAMDALKNYYRNYGHFLWGEYGFRDAFNLNENWCANIYMGLNQAPVTVMIENYRTGLLWKTFMKDPDIRRMVGETFEAEQAQEQAQRDSIIVVKGQVSDYYISVSPNTLLKGYVTDENGLPLEGATVMPLASPVHYNTRGDGYYELALSWRDSMIVAYYPGKEMRQFQVKGHNGRADLQLSPLEPEASVSHTAVATPWFDPSDDHPSTYCNPMNISYNFRARIDDVTRNGSFRSTADPMIVVYKGEYYLFSTNQSGFYRSKNLTEWEYVFAGFQRLPEDDDQCAPAAFVNGDTLFYTGSTYHGLPVWYSTEPHTGRFKRLTDRNVLPTWDPAFLLDDDGRLYQYYGSSNEYPLKGVEISRNDFYPVGKIADIMMLHPEVHGWERFGMNNDDSTTLDPFMEGAWVNKHRGKYYFQYGAPGTEFKVYADGVYVSDHPLGPYTYQKHNPVSYKPGGFVMGAGHGGTFADVFGNYWHVATCMVSLKYKFERRIGLYPAGFDNDGVMYANTSFGDYPLRIPSGTEEHTVGNFTGWMLLSLNKTMTASSSDSIYLPQNAADENIRTFWSAASGQAGEWLQIDLGAPADVYALQLNYYEHKAMQYNRAMDIYHQYRIYHSTDGVDWELLADKSDNATDVPHDYLQLRQPLRTRFLKLENVHMAAEGHFALSDFRVFGRAPGKAPGMAANFRVQRSKDDPRNAVISWNASRQAYGYNIYYGVDPGKMYNCITVYDALNYDFRGLDRDVDYYFTIEALGESGVSEKVSPFKV